MTFLSGQKVDERSSAAPGDGTKRIVITARRRRSPDDADEARGLLFCPCDCPSFGRFRALASPSRRKLPPAMYPVISRACPRGKRVRIQGRCEGRDSIGSSCSLFLLSLVLIEFQTRLGARSPRRPVALLSLFSSSGKKALSSAPLGKRRIVSTRGGRRDAKRGRSSSRAIGERAAAAAACSLLRFAHLDLLSSFPPPPTKKNFLTQAKTSASSSRTASSSRSPPRSTPAPGPAPPPRPRPRAGTRATESAAGEFCFFFFFRGRKKEDMKGRLTTSSSFLLLLLLVLSSNPTE